MSEVFDVVESVEGLNATFQILHYKPIQDREFFYAQRAGERYKQVRILLDNGSVTIEAGALHFMHGHITMENTTGGASGLMKKFASSMLTNESTFKPLYRGSGEIYLEPTFQHFLIYQLNNEEIIVDKGLFFACESTVEVGVAAQTSVSAAVKGGEGLFQTKLSGTGVCVLQSPVPAGEIMKLDLHDERLQVDGNFAILRTGDIRFTVEKSAKSILGSMTSGEGLLQTFTGTGRVWLAPTYALHRPPLPNPNQI